MAIISIQNVHKSFGSEVVFDELNLQLRAKEKIGMVGANGSGKTTILKLILGLTKPDMGDVVIEKGLRIAHLPQEPSFDQSKTLMEEMHAGVEHIRILQERLQGVSHELEGLTGSKLEAKMKQYDRLTHEFELAGGYAYEARIRMTLKGLGFDDASFDAKIPSLSGGQLSRLGLARVLMLETDLLLLDEPTNHLDLQATEWLESFLNSYEGAVVIISHDRYLLNRIATKIVDVEHRGATVWKGNYGNFVKSKEVARLQQTREHEARVEMVERTRDFIARNKDQEGMRGTARGRKTRLEKMLKENPDFLEGPDSSKTIRFKFARSERKSDLVLRCESLSKSFDTLTLFEDLTFDIQTGQRLGITGPNGTGKTTLLKILLGQVAPTSGTLRVGDNLRIGYLDQHGDVLNPEHTVLDAAREANPGLTPQEVRSQLGAFLLSGDDVFKEVGALSGGQRNRLMLCRLVLTKPDILILDEPTNHLDIASREMLEQSLSRYNGAIVVVSHDRYFLDRIVDRLLVVGTDPLGQRCDGRTEFVAGRPAYSHYAALLQKRREVQAQSPAKRKAPTKTIRRKGNDRSTATPPELKRFNKFTVAQIEERIMATEETIADLKERFGAQEVYRNPDLLRTLQDEFKGQSAELKDLYRAYERRA